MSKLSMLYRSVPTRRLASGRVKAFLVIGVHIMSLVCCDIGSQSDIELVRQANNEIQNLIENGTLDVSENAIEENIRNATKKNVTKVTSNDIFNNVSKIKNQATSNNETESFNNTESGIEHWRTVIGMSLLEEHFHEFIYNMTEGNSSAANDSHLALAINATTNMYTDDFLATLQRDIINKHYNQQLRRIREFCIRSKFLFNIVIGFEILIYRGYIYLLNVCVRNLFYN